MSMLDNGLLIEDANEIDQMKTCYGELIDEKMKNADRSRGAVSIYVPEDKNPPIMFHLLKSASVRLVSGMRFLGRNEGRGLGELMEKIL